MTGQMLCGLASLALFLYYWDKIIINGDISESTTKLLDLKMAFFDVFIAAAVLRNMANATGAPRMRGGLKE